MKKSDEGLAGYLLYSVHEREGMKQGYILDALARDSTSYASLFSGMDCMAKELGLAVVKSQTIDGSPNHKTLLSNGFTKHLARTAFIVKDVSGKMDECKKEIRWHISLADIDHA